MLAFAFTLMREHEITVNTFISLVTLAISSLMRIRAFHKTDMFIKTVRAHLAQSQTDVVAKGEDALKDPENKDVSTQINLKMATQEIKQYYDAISKHLDSMELNYNKTQADIRKQDAEDPTRLQDHETLVESEAREAKQRRIQELREKLRVQAEKDEESVKSSLNRILSGRDAKVVTEKIKSGLGVKPASTADLPKVVPNLTKKKMVVNEVDSVPFMAEEKKSKPKSGKKKR